MTLAVGGVPTAQVPALHSSHPTRPPTPPPRHCFKISRVLAHLYSSLPMATTPSPPIPHVPHSPEIFPSQSPSPPPPPPSYSISEFLAADLPPPPPLTLKQDMASPCYICCYDPPSPEVKSEYDPKLPPGFFSTPDIFPSSPPPPPLPPPPRPSPPSSSSLNEAVQRISTASPPPRTVTTVSDTMDLQPESPVEDHSISIETGSAYSPVSSSTLTATYDQTPDSVLSPLPPAALRVSPLSTDNVTVSSQFSTDSTTPSSDVSLTLNFFSATQDYTLSSENSKLLPQASVLIDYLYDATPSPDVPPPFLLVGSKLQRQGSPPQTRGQYGRMDSTRSEDSSSIPSEVSCNTTDTAGPAIMASPLSTDIPSLSSLPADLDSLSSGIGSLTTDTWSFSTEVDFQSEDSQETSTVKTKDHISSASNTANSTAESEVVCPSLKGSCTNTPMLPDYLTPLFTSPTFVQSPLHSSLPPVYESPSNTSSATPLFSSPTHTPIQSPLSPPPPYLHKTESPFDTGSATPHGMASPELLQTAELEFTSSGAAIPQRDSLERNPSPRHSFTPSPLSCCPNLFAVQRCNYAEQTGSRDVPCNTASLGNGQLSDETVEAQNSNATGKEKECMECLSNGSEKRESADEHSQGEDNWEHTLRREEERYNGGNSDAMGCSGNGDSFVVRDVNGNISYLGVDDGHEAHLENGQGLGESRSEAENTGSQIMTAGTMQPAIEVPRGDIGHEDLSPEVVKVLSSHPSPVPSPSLTYSPAGSPNLTPFLPDVPISDAPHLFSHIEAPLVASPRNWSSTFTHCNATSSTPQPCRAAQTSNAPKEAMKLLDEMVTNLENMSANLPASPTSKPQDSSPLQAAPVTAVSTADQLVTHTTSGSIMHIVEGSHNGDPEKLKEEACRLSNSSPIHTSPSCPTPISPTLSSQAFTSPLPPHACMSEFYSKPSTCDSPTCPSLTTNTADLPHSMSPASGNMPHPDPLPFLSCGSSDDHTNRTSLVENDTESAPKDETLVRSHWTDFQDSFPLRSETPLPSLCSSPKPGSLLDGQPSPSPAPRPRTPPTPPPRSCHNTPRSFLAPPPPPVRQYMLVPINRPPGASRQLSPPPAPPRSTSVHRSSPPPPPRPTSPCLPSPVQEWNKRPPLPPPPLSSSFTTPQPALTPVPEESSNPQSPVLPRSPCFSSLSEGVSPQTILLPDPLVTSQHLPSDTTSLSSASEDPPALPPPPEDEQEDEDLPPPPPPPPPIESDEVATPLPLPPPPSQVLFSPCLPPSPYSGRDELYAHLCVQEKPALPGVCAAASRTNTSSAPSSDPDLPPPAVDDVAIPLPPQTSNTTTSLKSPMPNSQTVDAATTSPMPLDTVPPNAPPSSPPLPPCAPGPDTEKAKAAKSPLITTSPSGKMVVVRSDIPLPTPDEEVRVAFRAAKDWGFLAEYEDTLSVYTQLRPVIQQGPQCGLVALSMASQVFPQTVDVEEIQTTGRALDVTRHGEMFSTTALARLAEKMVSGVQAEVRRDVLSSPATLLHLLLQGDLVLVPYDAERNHQPGLKSGHKAHWGVLCGCLVQSSALTFPTASAKLDSYVDNLWHLRPRSRAGRSRSVTPCPPAPSSSPRVGHRGTKALDTAGSCDGNPPSVTCSRVNTPMLSDLRHDDELRLVALWRQGKSRKVVAAPLEQLRESNDQLVSYPPPATPLEEEYMVGSLQEGLAGQVVVLHKTKAALSDLVGLLQEK